MLNEVGFANLEDLVVRIDLLKQSCAKLADEERHSVVDPFLLV